MAHVESKRPAKRRVNRPALSPKNNIPSWLSLRNDELCLMWERSNAMGKRPQPSINKSSPFLLTQTARPRGCRCNQRSKSSSNHRRAGNSSTSINYVASIARDQSTRREGDSRQRKRPKPYAPTEPTFASYLASQLYLAS